jgi:hypothetical protein
LTAIVAVKSPRASPERRRNPDHPLDARRWLDGTAAFDGQKTKTVSRVEIPRAGDRYPIWFDAGDHESFAYATIDNEQGKAQIRQLFGTAAETITGIADATAAADPIEQIRKLDELRTAGILTDAEFEQKKSELLGQV